MNVNARKQFCLYERFRLSISSLRGALTQPITPRDLEPRSSEEIDKFNGGFELINSQFSADSILDMHLVMYHVLCVVLK